MRRVLTATLATLVLLAACPGGCFAWKNPEMSTLGAAARAGAAGAGEAGSDGQH